MIIYNMAMNNYI